MQSMVNRGVDVLSADARLDRLRLGRSAVRTPARASLLNLFNETLQILSANSVSILWLAFFGLGGAGLVGAIINIFMLPVASGRGGFYRYFGNALNPQLVAQAGAGAITFILARGAITWIALHSNDATRPGLRAALRAALNRWPELLTQSLLYGIVITIGAAGVALLLGNLRIDAANFGRFTVGFSGMMRSIGVQSVGSVAPDPGPPFTQLLSYLRTLWSRELYFATLDEVPAARALWPMVAAGVLGAALIVIGETLLRLRTVVAMRDDGDGAYAGLRDSIRIGIRHFGYLTGRVWVLRLAAVLLGILFVILPTAYVQSMLIPFVTRAAGTYTVYPISQILVSLGSAAVNALFGAFAIVYDTRLYAALAGTGREL